MRKLFFILGFWLSITCGLLGQTLLEEDEGLGQYDYLCTTDSTWIHWSTDWLVWSTAEISVNLPGETVNYPSEWKHDEGGRKHLSTIQQISPQHFSPTMYQPGASISFNLQLNGTTLNTYTHEMMLFGFEKQDISGYIFKTSQQLVFQFYIDIGTLSGERILKGLHVKNIGTLEEGDGDKDIGYNGVKLYYETGTSFDFTGTEPSEILWGDWDGDSKYNNEWKNLALNITIPAGQRLYCYIVIENFSPTVTLGRTARFEVVVDGLWMDSYGSQHKNRSRIDAKTNSFALPLVESSFTTPGVVVSSYYNATDPRNEWTELLVVSDNLDLRGYTLRDNNADQNSWQPEVTFKSIDFWNHMRAGTIIKLWHRPVGSSGSFSGTLDFSKSDGYLELVLNDVNYFSGGSFGSSPSWAGPTMNIAGNGEIIQIRDAGGAHVHALAHKNSPGADYMSLPLPKLCHSVNLSSNQTLSVCPGGTLDEYGVLSPREDTIYTSKNVGQLTSGLPNTRTTSSSENENYWRSLRQPAWNHPTGNGSYLPGNTAINLSWSPCLDLYPSDNTTGYLILRNTENTFIHPSDGFSYNSGDIIGSAVVAGVVAGSSDTTFIDPISAPCDGVYYYRIYAFRFTQDETNGNNYHPARGRAYNETSFLEIIVVGPASPNTSLIWHY